MHNQKKQHRKNKITRAIAVLKGLNDLIRRINNVFVVVVVVSLLFFFFLFIIHLQKLSLLNIAFRTNLFSCMYRGNGKERRTERKCYLCKKKKKNTDLDTSKHTDPNADTHIPISIENANFLNLFILLNCCTIH